MTTTKTIVSGVAGRYATALFELAKQGKTLDAVESDLATIAGLIKDNDDFRAVIVSPLISKDEQQKAVLAILDKLGVQHVTRNFAGVVVANGRLSLLPEIIGAYGRLMAAERGEVTAEVASAQKLTAKQLESVSAMLAKYAGRDVKVQPEVDESLLGGLVVRMGSTMIDNSLKSKLDQLKLAMKEVG